MRTTLRIDDELLRDLKQRASAENISLSRAINDALRRGLAAQPQQRRRRFQQKTHHMGQPLVDLTKALAAAWSLEDETAARKLSQGK